VFVDSVDERRDLISIVERRVIAETHRLRAICDARRQPQPADTQSHTRD